ncbi:MAG: ATP-binding protein [Roseobacter sp.]
MPAVHANPADVVTVLQNLIVNGLTYNNSDQIEITVGFHHRVLVNGTLLQNTYFVQDYGIGIDSEFHKDVFRMFKRLNQTEAYGEGSGAGLTFIKRVLENNGGEIQLTSDPGQGSTFYFTFSEAAVDKAVTQTLSQMSTQHV